MSQTKATISARFSELAEMGNKISSVESSSRRSNVNSFYMWATSVLSLLDSVFGSKSAYFVRFNNEISGLTNNFVDDRKVEACRGIFYGARSEFDGGYILDLEKSFAGELFGDFVALAKAALSEGQHTVAAVLASAALEDALKRYATKNGLSVEGNTMEQVVNSLKSQGLVSGPQKALLSAMPKIRNHAMHADWDKLTPQDAASVVGFVEYFLLSNFS